MWAFKHILPHDDFLKHKLFIDFSKSSTVYESTNRWQFFYRPSDSPIAEC